MDTNKETTSPISVESTSSGNYFNVNPYLNSLQGTLTSNYTQVPPGYPIGNPQVPPGYPPGYNAVYYPSGTGGFPIYTPGYEEIFFKLLQKNEELIKKNEELTEQTKLNKPLNTSRYQTGNQRYQIIPVQNGSGLDRSRSPNRESYPRELSPDRVSFKRERSRSPDLPRSPDLARSQDQTSEFDRLYNRMKLLREGNKFFKIGMCKIPDCKNPLCQFSHSSIRCPNCHNKCQYNHRRCNECGFSNNYKTCKYFIKGICRHIHGVESNKPDSCGYLHGWKCYNCKTNNSNVYSTCIICNGPRMEINGF